jgi:hypothetical protein
MLQYTFIAANISGHIPVKMSSIVWSGLMALQLGFG